MSIISEYDLKKSVWELIDNAIDLWTKQSGLNLMINITLNERRQFISIEDNSGGIEEEKLDHIVAPGKTTNDLMYMTPSDFLIVLTLALTAWSIIAIEQRRFIKLFFSSFELFLGVIILLFIHYLLAFDWLVTNWLPGLTIFRIEKGIPSTVWAYIFALFILAYPIIKVNYCFFAGNRMEDLINLYRSLIDRNEIDLLANYIQKYHVLDIQTFLQQYSGITEEYSIDMLLRKKTKADEEYEKIIKPKRIHFAAAVYGSILTDEDFVKKASNNYPELFAHVIKGMESTRSSNRDFVQLYIKCLFDNKNQKFINELKIINGARDSIKSRTENIDLPILDGLLVNTKVAADNYVWYPVSQETMKSMKYDKDQLDFLKQPYDDDLENELWQQKIFVAIVYFNYMVRETIYRESGWHMWLFFYQYFLEELIKNIDSEVTNDGKEYDSFNIYLIKEIIRNIRDWLDLAADENTEGQTIDTLKCLGGILINISEAANDKLSIERKAELFESIISQYFELSTHQNHETASQAMTYMERMFKNPGNPEWNAVEIPANYQQILAQAWDDFDKIPYQGFENNGSIQRFTENVLAPLDIDDQEDE